MNNKIRVMGFNGTTAEMTLSEYAERALRQQRSMDSQVQPWQQSFGQSGFTHCMRIEPSIDDLFIYASDATDKLEPDETETMSQNTTYCKHFSVACVNGEYGRLHRAQMKCLLTAEQFERCRDAGWPNDWYSFLLAAYDVPQAYVNVEMDYPTTFRILGKPVVFAEIIPGQVIVSTDNHLAITAIPNWIYLIHGDVEGRFVWRPDDQTQ